MRKTFDAEPFTASHMRSPKGRGSWAFCPVEFVNTNAEMDHTVFSPSMTFVEARRWAAKHPAFADVSHVAVMP